jgi:signal transduction histidine kinase
MVEPLQARALSYNQRLEMEVSPDLPLWVSDVSRLGRIVAELLNNACKYTGPGGRILLRANLGEANTTLVIQISNDAEIPPKEVERIFDKFYRIPNTDPWQRGGTGLGLALVKKLVEQLGGKIGVDSQCGKTTFSVELPRGQNFVGSAR